MKVNVGLTEMPFELQIEDEGVSYLEEKCFRQREQRCQSPDVQVCQSGSRNKASVVEVSSRKGTDPPVRVHLSVTYSDLFPVQQPSLSHFGLLTGQLSPQLDVRFMRSGDFIWLTLLMPSTFSTALHVEGVQ